MTDTIETINDVDAIVMERPSDADEIVHHVRSNVDVAFTWDYERSRPALGKLYEKAKHSQWNGSTDLPWETDVDLEKLSRELGIGGERFRKLADLDDSPLAKWGEKEWVQFGVESQAWALSQFMHGEQGALVCTAQIVETVPWIDAKYYAATQVMDEARHVEVFARYLDEKVQTHYSISPQLGSLLDDIISDSRWDITYLGMQIMVEGLALAAFGMMHMITTDPLLKQLLRYVMSDEARHVAFGVLSLQEHYKDLTHAELRERQEFAFDAALRMRNRFFQQDVWERMGVDAKDIVRLMQERNDPGQQLFQSILFSKIVPNCKKLGLLDAADGWLRERFTEMGVISFENAMDTSEEYVMLDEVSKDRAEQPA